MSATHDLDKLVALLREDIVLAMPPHATWFRGIDAVVRFFRSPRFSAFWAACASCPREQTVSPPLPSIASFTMEQPGRHSIAVVRSEGGQVAEMMVFVGARYFSGFDLALTPDRTVSGAPAVMKGKGGSS